MDTWVEDYQRKAVEVVAQIYHEFENAQLYILYREVDGSRTVLGVFSEFRKSVIGLLENYRTSDSLHHYDPRNGIWVYAPIIAADNCYIEEVRNNTLISHSRTYYSFVGEKLTKYHWRGDIQHRNVEHKPFSGSALVDIDKEFTYPEFEEVTEWEWSHFR